MIKIDKDIIRIPDSLKIPNKKNFAKVAPTQSRTTHKRRLELISKGKYIDESIYNSRYKTTDIKLALKSVYNNKCAFCEQRIEQSHVEHYRPKKVYYWLAYSWDNLLLACSTCNTNKDVKFDLETTGVSVKFINNKKNIEKINQSSADYDKIEKPKMINPEVSDPIGKIKFQKNGLINSNDIRFSYTIKSCKIDRDYLNDGRRKLLDAYKKDINAELLGCKNKGDQEDRIGVITRKFVRDIKNIEEEFIAFRNYAISNNWLNDIVKEVIG